MSVISRSSCGQFVGAIDCYLALALFNQALKLIESLLEDETFIGIKSNDNFNYLSLYSAAFRPSLSTHFQTQHCPYQQAPVNPLAAPELHCRRRYSLRAERQCT